MKATHRVKGSDNNTVGFIIDNKYDRFKSYEDVVSNIDTIENLNIDKNKAIRLKNGALTEITKKELNNEIYKEFVLRTPLERDIQYEFNDWKMNKSKFVMYLTGARQIGKTTEIRKFAYKNYENIVYLDLSIEKIRAALQECIQNSNAMDFALANFCKRMKMEKFINNKTTILIIDEIQESSTVFNMIRSLQADLDCNIVVSGSYLGKILNSAYFKPAGNVIEVEMLPLSFVEFCRVFKQDKNLLSIDIFGNNTIAQYQQLNDLYAIYRQIGGYPAVVDEYRKNKNIDNCLKMLTSLINTFTEESASYFKNEKCRVIFENVYKAAFISMVREKKGTASKDIEIVTSFVKESTQAHVNRTEVNNAISWLKYSKIIGSCDLYNQGNPIDLLSERRFYFMDCGIANCISRMTAVNNSSINGILTENFVYTELYRVYKKGDVKGNVPCCSVYDQYELDFMIVDKDDVKYGIEVKTDTGDPTSLKIYISKKIVDIGIVAKNSRGGHSDNFDTIPIFAVGARFPYR